MSFTKRKTAAVLAIAASVAAGGAAAAQGPIRGHVHIDGSSTVAPITIAAGEMFRGQQSKVEIKVGISGTGGGFKKFLEEKADLRSDINDASRPIKKEELERAAKLGVEFIELPVALDGLAVLVNPSNTFCEALTVAELKRIWEPGSTINNWKDVRPGFPDLPLKLYGPGTDSGTFDYFCEAICGKEKASRSDYTASESDNVLVQGVGGDKGALGYFGYAYYESNREKLKLVAIDPGDGKPVLPSRDTVTGHTYRPLSRPLFIYVNRQAADRPEVAAFVTYLLQNARSIVEHPRVGYVALDDDVYRAALERFNKRVTGSVYAEAGNAHKPLRELFVP